MKAFDSTWEDIHSTTEWGRYPSEQVVRFVARNFYSNVDRSKVKLLDFGCGGGAHTWYASREGFDVYAFDGSKSAVEKAEKYLKADGLKAHFEVMDGVELQYDDASFDGVIDNVCIYSNTLDNIKQMYSECYRVLKKGGKMFTSVFSKDTLGYGTGELLEKDTYRNVTEGRLEGRAIVHFFNDSELRMILEEIGFKKLLIDCMEYTDKGEKVGMYFVTCEK